MDPLSLVPQHVRVLAQKGAVRGQAGSFPRNLHRPLPWSQPEELAFVAIIDISGYSKLSSYLQEVLGTDSGAKVKELLNKPINVIIKHVHQSGGSVVKFAGDAVIAMWPIDGHEDSSKRTVARRVFKGCLQLIAYFQNYELVIPEKINRSSSSSAASRMGTFNRRESSILPETGRRTSLMPDDIDKGPKKTQPLKIHIGLSADQLQHVHIGYAISPNDSNEVFPRSEYFVCGKGLKNAGILLGLGKPGDLTFDSASYNWVIDAMQTESSFPPVRKGSRELNARYFMVNDTDPVDKYLACLSQALSQTVEASKDVESILTLSTERHQHFTSIIVPYLDDALARSVRTIIPISQSQELDGESPYTVDLTNYDQLRGVAILFVYFPAFNVETIAENKNLEILQKISLIVIEAIRKHQGCLRQFNCDDKSMTALLVWGLEGFAHEQGECYFSMAAAMDMASQLKEVIGSDFAIGATKGTVFAGIIGNSNRSDGTLLGVCVNNAARLMCLDRCKGGILCDDETFKDTSDDFEYDTEIPEVTLKGVAAPVKIYAPLRRKQKGQNVKSQSVSFQGREKETKALNSVVASWLNDVKERVLIEGRSGTGKSATARALENNIRKDASNFGKMPRKSSKYSIISIRFYYTRTLQFHQSERYQI
ncbi:hypothetical protein BC830DRAFT_612136 [Chytriomyces sp. MP71]|nr:hypothetical protein BC830DRAFT_612136 [Chytriomyces sp. MP71]